LTFGFFCFIRETFQRTLGVYCDRVHHSRGQASEKIPRSVDVVNPNLHMPRTSLLGPYSQ
jgi:hypothetical protein